MSWNRLRQAVQRAAVLSHTPARCKSTAVGFAGLPLHQPADWQAAAADAVSECDELVRRIVSTPPSAAIVQLLDNISDTVCKVLDAAEFCRNVHSDAEWRRAAQQVCIDLGAYVHDLNTNYGIYTALVHALEAQSAAAAAAAAAHISPTSSSSSNATRAQQPGPAGFCEETLLVGRMLRRDFERYGVHLSGEARDRMTALVQETQQLGMQITQNVLDPGQYGTMVLNAELAGAVKQLPLPIQRKCRPLADSSSGRVQGLGVPGDSHTLNSILRISSDEELRRHAYMAYHQQPAANIELLDRLVVGRHEIASIMGHDSYAAYQLQDFSLAHHPAAVQAFLRRLAAEIHPRCQAELAQLSALKQRLHHEGAITGPSASSSSSSSSRVQPWDRGFLLGTAKVEAAAADLSVLPQHFTLNGCVEGLSQLTRQLMGVSLEEQPLEPGEGWAPGVRRLAALHESDGFLGVVYLDLFRRANKFPSAAHFTLRCGRALPDGTYQTPVVALVAGLGPDSGLAHSEVEMLAHEFGHALNSLLSRTRYQHLSGTRGPLDMVEVPSHTLELFASDPRVLQRFASPDASGRPVDGALLQEVTASKRRFAALEHQLQLQYCLIDQLLHGPSPPTGRAAQQAVAELMAEHSCFGHVPGTLPHLRFTHIVGYGAVYHSYLYAQCIAAQLWQRHLAGDPLGRAAGERLRRRLLEPGGAKEAHHLVQDLFEPATGSPVLIEAEGGWFPDPAALLASL